MKNYNKTNSSKYADISVFDFDEILSDKDYRHSLRISKKEQKIAERQKNKKVQEIVQKLNGFYCYKFDYPECEICDKTTIKTISELDSLDSDSCNKIITMLSNQGRFDKDWGWFYPDFGSAFCCPSMAGNRIIDLEQEQGYPSFLPLFLPTDTEARWETLCEYFPTAQKIIK